MRVLFVCTGNTCRSSMAEGLFNYLAKSKGIKAMAKSAGTFAPEGGRASEFAIEVLKENYGVDISHHVAHNLKEQDIEDADLVLTMTKMQRDMLIKRYVKFSDKIFTVTEFVGSDGEILDPFGKSKETYLKTAKELYDIIIEIIDKLNGKE